MKKIKREDEIIEYFNNSPKRQNELFRDVNLTVFWKLYNKEKYRFIYKDVDGVEVRLFVPHDFKDEELEWEKYI